MRVMERACGQAEQSHNDLPRPVVRRELRTIRNKVQQYLMEAVGVDHDAMRQRGIEVRSHGDSLAGREGLHSP